MARRGRPPPDIGPSPCHSRFLSAAGGGERGRPELSHGKGLRMTSSAATLGSLALCVLALAACGPDEARTARLQKSPQWHGDHFENPQPLWVDTSGAYK